MSIRKYYIFSLQTMHKITVWTSWHFCIDISHTRASFILHFGFYWLVLWCLSIVLKVILIIDIVYIIFLNLYSVLIVCLYNIYGRLNYLFPNTFLLIYRISTHVHSHVTDPCILHEVNSLLPMVKVPSKQKL